MAPAIQLIFHEACIYRAIMSEVSAWQPYFVGGEGGNKSGDFSQVFVASTLECFQFVTSCHCSHELCQFANSALESMPVSDQLVYIVGPGGSAL